MSMDCDKMSNNMAGKETNELLLLAVCQIGQIDRFNIGSWILKPVLDSQTILLFQLVKGREKQGVVKNVVD